MKYVDAPAYVNTWHVNHYMALQFEDQDDADSISVGILNQVELDIDMIAVIAVDDLTKPLKVVVTKGEDSKTFEYNLSGLTLAAQA